MKSISCTIWVLSLILVAATLDRVPDPPAADPSTAVISLLQAHSACCDIAVHPFESTPSSDIAPVVPVVDSTESDRPADRIVLTGQAADPSPPQAILRPSTKL